MVLTRELGKASVNKALMEVRAFRPGGSLFQEEVCSRRKEQLVKAQGGVFVSSVCSNKVSQSGWLKNNKHLFPHSLGGQESEIKVLAGPAPFWRL